MDKVFELRNCVNSLSQDSYKFFNRKNKAAGVRARKKLQRCKELAQEIRSVIQKVRQDEAQKKARVLSAHVAIAGADFINGIHENQQRKESIQTIFSTDDFEEKMEDNEQDYFTGPRHLENTQRGLSEVEKNKDFLNEIEGYNKLGGNFSFQE